MNSLRLHFPTKPFKRQTERKVQAAVKGKGKPFSLLRVACATGVGSALLGAAYFYTLPLPREYRPTLEHSYRACGIAFGPSESEKRIESDTKALLNRSTGPSLINWLTHSKRPYTLANNILTVPRASVGDLAHEWWHMLPWLHNRNDINHDFASIAAELCVESVRQSGETSGPGANVRPPLLGAASFEVRGAERLPNGWWRMRLLRKGREFTVTRNEGGVTVAPDPFPSPLLKKRLQNRFYELKIPSLGRYFKKNASWSDRLRWWREHHNDTPLDLDATAFGEHCNSIASFTTNPAAAFTVLRGVAMEGLSLQEAEWLAISGADSRRETKALEEFQTAFSEEKKVTRAEDDDRPQLVVSRKP